MATVFARYKERFLCSTLVNLSEEKRSCVESGGKIIMPPSVLAKLSNMNIAYPLMFKLTNTKNKKITHTGVLEFVAEETKIYLPSWLMKNLEINEGETLTAENASLPAASYSRFQPLSVSFLDITNPKAVMENCLRRFACLTTGDILSINYNSRTYELKVLETRPSFAVSIIDCDVSVDFDAPQGYHEPIPEAEEPSEFAPFIGKGNRLDGKERKRKKAVDEEVVEVKSKKKKCSRGVPDYEYEIGSLQFFRNNEPSSSAEKTNIDTKSQTFKPFNGEGRSML